MAKFDDFLTLKEFLINIFGKVNLIELFEFSVDDFCDFGRSGNAAYLTLSALTQKSSSVIIKLFKSKNDADLEQEIKKKLNKL